MEQPEYKKAYPDLVKRMENEYNLIKQWGEATHWLPNQVEHYYKCLALLELLEIIAVRHIGFGRGGAYATNPSRRFDDRVKSFL